MSLRSLECLLKINGIEWRILIELKYKLLKKKIDWVEGRGGEFKQGTRLVLLSVAVLAFLH